jgi:hypothetical protein
MLLINRSRRAEGKRATSSKKRNRPKKLIASDPQSEQMQQKRQGRWQACHQLRLLWFVHDETCRGANKSDGAAWRELSLCVFVICGAFTQTTRVFVIPGSLQKRHFCFCEILARKERHFTKTKTKICFFLFL